MRRALTGWSSLKGVCLGNPSSFWWKKDGSLRKTEICFLGLPNGNHTAKVTIFSSLPVPYPVSALSSPTLDTQEQFQSEEMDSAYGLKTVHVKFQLQKECSFGQRFLMVGYDPMFGAWDTSKAVPLTWSEGHLWTLEMDIPIGKSIVYKLLLKEGDDVILWQPGPDRVVETWETSNTITVCEDWDNAELRNIIDGEREESDINPEMLIAENTLDHDKSSGNQPGFLVADNITGPRTSSSVGSRVADCAPAPDDISGVESEMKDGNAPEVAGLVFDEETQVLVPGLNQILGVESESSGPLNDDQTELNSSEADSSPEKETSEVVFNGLREMGDVKQASSELSVFEGALQWGRTTHHKLLTNLGLV